MNAYRLSGTVKADRTITVQMPDGAEIGAEAEVIVLFPHQSARGTAPHPLALFLGQLKAEPGQKSTADEEQVFLKQIREEWE